MSEVILLHTATHLRFFLRSRLVLGFGMLVLGLWGVQLVPFFFMSGSGPRFELLKHTADAARGLGWFLAAGLGLFTVSSHLRNRSIQLVLTRPGSPRLWLASVFVAAFTVALAIQVVVALLTFGLSWLWAVPYPAGFLFLSLDSLCETVIAIAILTLLGVLLHPVIAALAAFAFNDLTFYGLDYTFQGMVASQPGSAWLPGAAAVVRAIHLALPMLDPFASRTDAVEETLRVTGGDWVTMAAIAAYSLGVAAFCFLAADLALARRRLGVAA